MGAVKQLSPRPRLSKDFVLEVKRTRLMEATAQVVSEKGIDGAEVTDLIRKAGVARKTIYDIFSSKDDCLEQTLSWIGERVHQRVGEGLKARAIGNRARVRHGLSALLDFVAEHPDQARFYLLHGPTVSLSIFETAQGSFASLLEPFDVDESARAMVVGGIAEALRHQLSEQPEADPRLLLNGFTDFTTYYVGDSTPVPVAA